MKLSLGFSTCPNDTFIFDAMVHQKIDTEGLEFKPFLGDVEELNKKAFQKELDITKLSYHAFAYLSDCYMILDSGSALGEGNGPILLSKRKIYPDEIRDLKIAVPGKYTTANLLLGIAYPQAQTKKEYLFSDIEEAILSNEVDAGLVIHENRFTYASKGLRKVIDLGEFWEDSTGELIPLGGIVVLRSIDNEVKSKVNRVLRKSLEFAFNQPEKVMTYVKQYAQEMDEEIMMKHIGLYVNNYTLELGERGKSAIRKFFDLAEEKELIPSVNKDLFVSENL